MAHRLRIIAVLTAASVLLFVAPVITAADSSKGKITFDRYYSIEVQGQRCGYGRSAVRESAEQITTLSYDHINLRIYGQNALLVFKDISRETPDGKLISIVSTRYFSDS